VLNFKYDQLALAFVVILAIVTIIRVVAVYLAQRKSRTLEVKPDISEKPTSRPSLDREDSAVCQKYWEFDHNDRLNSLKQEILQHTEKPIYPWVSPPQALPGPYDPMYFPLPAPTIRKMPLVSSPAKREGRHSTSYTRLVPDCGTPPRAAVLYGTMTTSTNGWRRTHWNVTGG
jgi:hypothetical protein